MVRPSKTSGSSGVTVVFEPTTETKALIGQLVSEARKIVEHLREEFSHCPNFRPTVSTMDYRLRDSFYCGKWVIKPGSKKERVIDLRKISLPDGTRFTPMISEEEFQLVQDTRRKNKSSVKLTRKRVNPRG